MGLRPVGEPLGRAEYRTDPPAWKDDYRAIYLRSGTEALALALCETRSASTVDKPAVILPAYGCPDLVSAARFAGLRALFADLQDNSPFMDPAIVHRLCRGNVIAVVATHFLGLADPLQSYHDVCGESKAIIVEDSAQRFPIASLGEPSADLVVLSFGRGKPVNALGGGALLYRGRWLPAECSKLSRANRSIGWLDRLIYWIRRLTYNALIKELPYSVISQLPATGVGETKYRRTSSIRTASPQRHQRIWSAIASRHQKQEPAQSTIRKQIAKKYDSVVDLTEMACAATRLLRYPLLLPDIETRNRVLTRLRASGLGGSFMYGSPLPMIRGVVDDARAHDRASYPRASAFADRLLTLPVHSGVTSAHVQEMSEIFALELG